MENANPRPTTKTHLSTHASLTYHAPMAPAFQVVSEFQPTGDQPAAIDALSRDILGGKSHTCLLGATGTGKTFTMAHVIARLQKPTLILSHNKTLAAQLFEELREFLPRNSVNYFVSYYDYYQPEAYIPQRDIYIEKDSSRNDDLDQLRLQATSNILARRDTVVVSSVSCIFGLGSPLAYGQRVLTITKGSRIERRAFLLALNAMQYQRTDMEWKRGQYRVRGDAIDIWPAYEKYAVHVDLFGDEIDRVDLINPTSGEVLAEERQFFLFPAVHYVMPEEQLQSALIAIRQELDERVLWFRSQGKLLEAQRLLSRTKFDLELLEETGTCPGIENYSRFMDGRMPGERPYTLLDYFDFAPPAGGAPARPGDQPASALPHFVPPSPAEGGVRGYRSTDTDRPAAETIARPNLHDWLLIIDESHVTMPQVRAMFNGDRARKEVLVEHGFRLPSAMDNRPLRFEEFESVVPRMLFVSATPGSYELGKCGGVVAEQVIRPTGLLDPEVEVKPTKGQVPDLLVQCEQRVAAGERILVTALTKRLCEDLAGYIAEKGLRVRYLHSDIETLDRMQILTDLRLGNFDVLVGVNLLREGLDLPEVSLVAILDADKEGFLRSPTSLIQLMGRAARNVNGRVVMYADTMTAAMTAALDETERRRAKQRAYNAEHGITPQTIVKAVRRGLEAELLARKTARLAVESREPEFEIDELLKTIQEEMVKAAQSLEFEKAAALRDQIGRLKQRRGELERSGLPTRARRSDFEEPSKRGRRAEGAKAPGTPGARSGRRRGR
ncbi:UvrABC system protein B [Phycisphaerales bacterium]|nr:UvrABC system protein B [Phycisphaerales bacterium]